ncbi:MAG: hypothetical protein DWQ34_04250 [Planctomycetota bacterium]|nr:MAG: hypothetical protein DWQ34_04250 [Planctomycetota bacterium]REK20311.1 MAG: hypothetical protein DWQ41_25295 [Planctomycetota bacterium]REK26808.1 MAG: hypothetical protein DWQ45_26595 [Planctomycetota bacterium]
MMKSDQPRRRSNQKIRRSDAEDLAALAHDLRHFFHCLRLSFDALQASRLNESCFEEILAIVRRDHELALLRLNELLDVARENKNC